MSELQYNMLFSDIDGTLMNSRRRISANNRRSINEYRNAGGIFSLATGRNYMQTHSLIHELGINIPVILCDGAMLYDPIREEEQVLASLTHLQGEQILEEGHLISKEIYVYFACYNPIDRSHHFYGVDDLPIIRQFCAQWSYSFTILPSFRNIPSTAELITAVIYIADLNATEPFHDWYQKQPDLYGTAYSDQFIELSAVHATKGHGIRTVCEQLNHPLDRVAAIGDHINDLPMVDLVGCFASLANGEMEVMDRANILVRSNDEDGFSDFIRHLLNL
ncbi:Cof subfamily of IIB subfamily of haloacid dehalogenase superfamily/HAD-superfamily hydrolase, subfamily IIB [Seinonella peptonophila]|uniref:Cof subfamily of IIB subfamily of haloacid dehalogenase superfamily/HAD-superfamily hydrolase, subfamily IIB n=1 Tax=Seinonella peptonophila TaxID=112248 RepID=A0A1M4VHF9_9BACL|nr:HAD-IIB family hydrolase [Seinonella peptonophila]SHE68409.1 Cof subfamily of IIB subfamily of haloacid dehalogenase superfamily/HAD-superfamily hydrolase, subfamily IIB [Seinonella peptonophila]